MYIGLFVSDMRTIVKIKVNDKIKADDLIFF